jgi:anti-sigma B factor antagonist
MQADFVLDPVAGGGSGVRLRVSGELDLYTAPLLTEAVHNQARAGQRVVVDLEKVSFMDSTGVSALIGVIQDAGRNGWELAVARRLSPEVSRVMHLSGLQPLLDSIASDDDA